MWVSLKTLQTKVASEKFSEEKVFLVVDTAVKVRCFYIDQHLAGYTILVSSITGGKFIFAEHTEMCWGIDHFFKNAYRGINSLSQYFQKELYQYVKITWLLLTEKHVCWSPFFILSIAKFLRAPILKNICERLLLKMCSWNWEKLKFIHKF